VSLLREANPDVSRETLDKLELYIERLLEWSQRINLVSKSTGSDIWSRHVADSAQLFSLRPKNTKFWCDLGAGGGLPGMVVAILASELDKELCFCLVESDRRKAAFLSIVARELDLEVVIRNERAESLQPVLADLVSARALAPLDHLLSLVSRHLSAGGVALLPKGRRHHEELNKAYSHWTFDLKIVKSLTDFEGRILCIRNLQEKQSR